MPARDAARRASHVRAAPLAAVAAAVLALLLAGPAPLAPPSAHAQGGSAAEAAAEGLRADPVFVHPRAREDLSGRARDRLRARIARRAPDRIRVAVLPASAVARAGSAAALAQAVDERVGGVRGALVVVAGRHVHVITSFDPDRAVSAVRAAFDRNRPRGLGAQLLAAVDGLAEVDPGPERDPKPPPAPPSDELPEDFLDDIGEGARLALLIVAIAFALPFVVVAFALWRRHRRRSADEDETLADALAEARDELIVLGDEIRALDLDTEMPGASARGLTFYEAALAAYDRANREIGRARSMRRVARARAAIADGRACVASARALLGSLPRPAAPRERDPGGSPPGGSPPSPRA